AALRFPHHPPQHQRPMPMPRQPSHHRHSLQGLPPRRDRPQTRRCHPHRLPRRLPSQTAVFFTPSSPVTPSLMSPTASKWMCTTCTNTTICALTPFCPSASKSSSATPSCPTAPRHCPASPTRALSRTARLCTSSAAVTQCWALPRYTI